MRLFRDFLDNAANPRRVNRKKRSQHKRQRRAFNFESLELRQLLAASASFAYVNGVGTLQIFGEFGQDVSNNISVGYQPSGGSNLVTVTDNSANILQSPVFTSSVNKIVVEAYGGNDQVNLTGVTTAQYTQLFYHSEVNLGTGNDYFFGSSVVDVAFGSDGDDILYGYASTDYLYGHAGNDQLFGDNGANSGGGFPDQLFGEVGNDVLKGDQGDDVLSGGNNDDVMFGDDDADFFYEEAGDDRFVLTTGNDTIGNGGPGGIDTLDFSSLTAGATFDLSVTGTQTLPGGQLTVSSSAIVIENAIGTSFNDTIAGNSLGERYNRILWMKLS